MKSLDISFRHLAVFLILFLPTCSSLPKLKNPSLINSHNRVFLNKLTSPPSFQIYQADFKFAIESNILRNSYLVLEKKSKSSANLIVNIAVLGFNMDYIYTTENYLQQKPFLNMIYYLEIRSNSGKIYYSARQEAFYYLFSNQYSGVAAGEKYSELLLENAANRIESLISRSWYLYLQDIDKEQDHELSR